MNRTLIVTIVLAVGMTAPGLGQTGRKRSLTIEDYYRVKTGGGLRLSDDGRTVTFTASTRVEENNQTVTETFTAPVEGSAAPAKVDTPRERGGNQSAPVSVASRDGKWIATLKEVAPPVPPAPNLTDFEKRHLDRFKGVTFDWKDFQRDGQPFPAPNLRARPRQQVVVTTAGGGDPKVLLDQDLRPTNLVWHPDGSQLAFVADPDWRNELKYENPDLYTVTTAGEVTRLTNDGYVYSDLEYSPDGRSLAYTRTFGTDLVIAQKLNHGGPRDLYIRPTAGGEPTNLTANWDLEPRDARFSPDGKFLYFTAGIGGEAHLFRASVPGGHVTQVTRGARRLGNLVYDKSMTTIAYTVTTHDRPAEIYVAKPDGSAERRISDVNGSLFEALALGKTDRLEWASKDGTRIEGWITYPAPSAMPPAGSRAPLIVFSHGGPHSATGYAFDFKKQFFAARGYFVLDTNFRSSTNYGEAFKWATWGAWGDKDGQDVIAGVDYVLARYPIDPQHVGHTGHSYGGFMTNWLITQYPDRFAAAITGAGITNWISDYGTADIYRTKETEFFGTPWDPAARERMIKQSPLTYAGNVKTPTLFIHGEVDQRVPYEEGEQMYFALKRRGIPAKMYQYADQPHGITGHWNVVHRMLVELDWWNTYLRVGPTEERR
ncbi:MAG: S9 family peptidase [Vicinamibacterales bacterium]